MKQSVDQIQTFQTLYELSMSIGTSLDLRKMLKVSLLAFLKRLDCVAGGVYLYQPEADENHRFEAVHSIPRHTARNVAYQTAVAQLPSAADAGQMAQFLENLPLTRQSEDENYYHILELPGFGMMILVKNKKAIDPLLLKSLRPLLEKLAAASKACLSEKALRQAQERSQTILESVTVPLLISRVADGKIVYANQLLSDMIRVPLTELINEVTPDFYADVADRQKLLTALQEHGALANYELHLKRSDGELIWVLISIRPFQFQGETALITTLIDITERKQTVQELTESRLRNQSILESVTLPLLISRVADGKVLYANERVAGMIGIALEEVIGKQTPNFYSNPEDRQDILNGIREKGGNDNKELSLVHADGHRLWVLLSNRLVQFEGETAIITTLIDITDRKLAEEALAKRAAELETVARVSASAATILETDHLLQEVVDLTKERFDLYHVHIYLLNNDGDTLVLATGAGDIGRQMVAENRSIPLAQEQSLVALAARTKQGVIENDVRSNPAFLPHPLLPQTRAEMAVPMLVGERVVGVLDVQAEQKGHFTSQDVVVQTALAAQTGVALENARSFERTQTALADAEESRQSIQEFLDMQRILHELNIELFSIENLDELYSEAIKIAHDRFGFERIGMYLLNDTKDALVGTYGFGENNEFRNEQGPEFEIKTYDTIERFIINRTRLQVEEDDDLWDTKEVIGRGWHISAAMWVEENPIGVIFADNLISGRPMKPYEPELLFSFASIVASMIERRRIADLVSKRAAELQESQMAIQERELLLRTIIDSTPDWIFVKDKDHRYMVVNKGYADSFNMQPDDLVGKDDLEIGFPEDIVKGNPEKGIVGFWPDDDEVIESGEMKVVDVEPAVIDGKELFLSTIKSPLKNVDGEVTAVVGFVHDITQRIEIENRIRERETLMRTIMDSTPDWIFVKDKNHRYMVVNKGYADAFNMEPDDLVGKDDLEIGFPEDIVKGNPEKGIVGFWPDDDEVIESGQMKIVDVEPAVVDGKEIFLSTIKSPLKNADGEVTAVVGFVHDITQRIEIENTIRERETLMRTIIDSTPDWIFVKDKNHRYMVVNKGYANSFNMQPDDLVGKDDLEIGFPEDIVKGNPEKGIVGFWPDDDEVLESGEMKVIDVEPAVVDGKEIFLSTIKSPLKNVNGEVTAVVGFVHDITQRIEIENTIRERETLMRTIIDSTPDWIFVKDVQHRYLLANKGYADSLNMSPDDFVGKDDLELGFPEEIVKGNPEKGIVGFWPDDDEVIASGQMKIVDVEPAVVDGEEVFLSTIKSPLKDENERVTAVVGFVNNITDRVRAEKRLARQAQELQTVAQVSTTVATTLEQDKLLQEVVDLTKEKFDLYHAHIYLLNERKDTLVLTAGAGEVGRKLVLENHRIDINAPQSFVAQAARSAQAVVENQVRQNPGFLANPLLPDTQSEMAIPMIVGERVVGVLDVQADSRDYFSEQDVQIQTTLAAQFSIALENARSFEQAQKAVAEMNELTQQLTREGWQEYLQKQGAKKIGYVYDANDFDSVRPVNGSVNTNGAEEGIPKGIVQAINIRGEAIGHVVVLPEDDNEEIDPEIYEILGIITEQLGARIDNLRLAEETQVALSESERQSEELVFINHIVTEISKSLDLSESLATIARELARIITVSHVGIALMTEDQNFLEVITEFPLPEAGSPEDVIGQKLPIKGYPLTEKALETRKYVVAYDAQNNPLTAPIHEILRQRNIEALAVFPMIIGDVIFGTVAFDVTDPERVFNDGEMRLAETIVHHTTTAVQNSKLFDQTQQALKETEEQAHRLSELNHFSAALNQADSLSDIYKSAVVETPNVVPVDRASLSLLADSGEYFYVVATWGEESDIPVGAQLPAANSPLLTAIQEGRIVTGATDDVIKLAMFIPLFVSGKAVGTLNIGRFQGESFSNQEENLMRQVAAMVSTNIENMQFLANEQSRAQREQMLRQITQRIRSSADMETIMRTAVQEIGRTLGRKTYIYLGDDHEA